MNLGTPWTLFLMPLVAVVAWLIARARRMQRDAALRLKGCSASSPLPSKRRRELAGLRPRDCLTLAAMACIVLALAQPRWNPRPYEVERRGRDLVIALDVSRSMLAADLFPSRLEAARIAIHESLPAWTGQRIALITFAGSATVRVPLTLDHGFVRYMLDRADPSDEDVGSTSLQAAFEKAADTVLVDAAGGRRDLIVFTDGEDHLSNIEKTAEMLAKCGARILIVGLGDPVQGARVPDASGTDRWMQYKGAEVVSRLQEGTLAKLCEKSRHATYYPARTRPFDLVSLYERMTSEATNDVVVGELREVHYTEGYPYLLGLAVALWLASSPLPLPKFRSLVLLVLLVQGCIRPIDDGDEETLRAKVKQGEALLQHAQEQSAVDVTAARSLLLDAREQFLRAGLLKPGDLESARQVTLATHRLQEIDAAIEKQRAEEKKRGKQLSELIAQLEELAERQTRLSQQSSQLLRRRLLQADLSNSDDSANEAYDDSPAQKGNNNDRRLARTAAAEQRAVREGTTDVLDAVKSQQSTLQQLLAQAYGDTAKLPPTELDPAIGLLTEAAAAQQQSLGSLTPEAVGWPQANTAFHVAAGRMKQAVTSLRSLQPPAKDQDNSAMPPMNDNDYQEDMEASDSDAADKKSQPISPGDLAAALALESLPVPNYTSAEILAEEAANQQRRASQKAARAGDRVEKNW